LVFLSKDKEREGGIKWLKVKKDLIDFMGSGRVLDYLT
jgi:hypothetical protein